MLDNRVSRLGHFGSSLDVLNSFVYIYCVLPFAFCYYRGLGIHSAYINLLALSETKLLTTLIYS